MYYLSRVWVKSFTYFFDSRGISSLRYRFIKSNEKSIQIKNFPFTLSYQSALTEPFLQGNGPLVDAPSYQFLQGNVPLKLINILFYFRSILVSTCLLGRMPKSWTSDTRFFIQYRNLLSLTEKQRWSLLKIII